LRIVDCGSSINGSAIADWRSTDRRSAIDCRLLIVDCRADTRKRLDGSDVRPLRTALSIARILTARSVDRVGSQNVGTLS
jgi:hypothetical protein